MHTSSQEDKLLELRKLEDALCEERDNVHEWMNRIKDDLYKVRMKRAKLLCPYSVGSVLVRRLRNTPNVCNCLVVGIRPMDNEWGYSIATKAFKANGKLCATIVVIHKSGNWGIVK